VIIRFFREPAFAAWAEGGAEWRRPVVGVMRDGDEESDQPYAKATAGKRVTSTQAKRLKVGKSGQVDFGELIAAAQLGHGGVD
jgi:hypothetical protein